jgi:hypothetical protein
MKLNAPRIMTFWIALIMAVVGVVVYAVHLFARNIPYLQPAAFLFVLAGFALLCLGLTVKGL